MTTFISIAVSPKVIRYDLLLTATTPLSHHDPAIHDESNRMLFNRQKQLLPVEACPRLPSQEKVDALTAAHPVPADIADVFQDVSFAEFVACVLARQLIDQYNSMEGTGLFEGMERYARLETRLRMAAVVAPNLRAWWDRLCGPLQLPIHGGDSDATLLRLLTVPAAVQQLVLRTLAEDYRSVVALARLWHTTAKQQNVSYAAATNTVTASPDVVELMFDADQIPAGSGQARVLEVPAVSGNSLRHQVVREPSWLHLRQQLGLAEAEPGQGPVPAGVEAVFYNGGNIAAGAKQPSNTFGLAAKARRMYPSLDLLGGVTDSFDLGESRLGVVPHMVCRENRAALQETPAYDLPAATISIFDMLDDVTLTRQAGRLGLGQMIMSFEALCPGAQVLCRLCLSPWTPVRTHGALVAAIETFLANGASVGGQAARGFGACQGKVIDFPEGVSADEVREEYEDYLQMNRENLVSGLCDGTLGTGARILT